jgi:predicted transcriptional regulator
MVRRLTRVERFRIRNRIAPAVWAAKAGMSRQTLRHVLAGNDPYVATARALVRAASEILGRHVGVSELFDVGEDAPVPEVPVPHKTVSDAHRKTLKRYATRLDRVLRGERIVPSEFARHVEIVRQTLLRFRTGQEEPCLSTLANMVAALRQMTGKRYLASHLYDLGEGLADLSPGTSGRQPTTGEQRL